MIAAAWLWALLAILAFLVLGLLLMLALGLVGVPGDLRRRAGQTLAAERVDEEGTVLPPEVPDSSARETAARADEVEDQR